MFEKETFRKVGNLFDRILSLCVCLQLARTVLSVDQSQENDESVCQDRLGISSSTIISGRSCSMCYRYLFPELVTAQPQGQGLATSSQLQSLLESPNSTNDTWLSFVCETLSVDKCLRWRACCSAARECCERQTRAAASSQRPPLHCPRTWDGYSCWDDTPAGTTVSVICPFFINYARTTKEAIKSCTENSTWFKKGGHEWTDYTTCMDKQGYLPGFYIIIGCNVASFSLLVPAMVIYIVFRDLNRQHRVRLHINLFLSLALCCVVTVSWFSLVHYDLLSNPDNLSRVFHRNPIWCRLLSFLKLYVTSSTYFWMFCEGYYIHRLITNAFRPPKSSVPFYFVGWGVSAVPALLFASGRMATANDSCWARNAAYYQWIIDVPNFSCLVVNVFFLCNILRILLFQLHSHPDEPSNFRRGLKAAFMLIPLFGLQLYLTIYRPQRDSAGSREYEYISAFIMNSQGLFVSLIYCFCNGEVINHLRNNGLFLCLESHKTSRYEAAPMILISKANEGRKKSARNGSIPSWSLSRVGLDSPLFLVPRPTPLTELTTA